MTERKPALLFTNVSKSFPKTEDDSIVDALKDLNFSIEGSELISIVGTSGCGKSTILRLIAGLITPTQGTVTINGVPITHPGPSRGMVFQKPSLFHWLTVEKNIAFSLKLQGSLRKQHDKVERMLNLIGLEDFRNDYPHQLSGGMAQRVALARTLINEPEILLLDEPLSSLDAFTRMNMQDEILNISKEKKQMVVMVTHDVDEAIYMGTRVLVMKPRPGMLQSDISIDLEYPASGQI